MEKRIRCIISGRVQMVMFRDYVTRKARRLKINGFVENLDTGTVHVVAEGEEEALEQFMRRLHEGSLLSRVDTVEAKWFDSENEFTSFNIKY